jgi:hypothetical protein
MAFRNGANAKLWKIEPHENYTDVQLSTSHKVRGTDPTNPQYENDFSGFARFIGGAHDKIKNFPQQGVNGSKLLATIKLEDVACTKVWSREHQKEYTNFQVYDFSLPEQAVQPTQRPSADSFNYIPDGVEEQLPFS